MITEILSDGTLSITGQTQLECYALRMWCEKNPLREGSSVLIKYEYDLGGQAAAAVPVYDYTRAVK